MRTIAASTMSGLEHNETGSARSYWSTTSPPSIHGSTVPRRAPVGTRPQDRFVSVEHLGVCPFISPCKRHAPSEVPCACV
jgi:hypothetical protein